MATKPLTILYHHPLASAIYAQRSIHAGFEHAFEDMGHKFISLTPDQSLKKVLESQQINVFISSSHFFYQKFLDYGLLKEYRQHKNLKMLTKVDFWDSPLAAGRINEAKSLKDDAKTVALMKKGLLGDAFFHVVEHGDKRMKGFKEAIGMDYHTVPLAADKRLMGLAPDQERFGADISYIGTNLPEKRAYFEQHIFPLSSAYNLRLYGQDWTGFDRALGWVQRGGQYFNLRGIRSIRKPKLALEDEARIYATSKICLNVHEDYQRKFGGDCNERTFKVPLYSGFELADDVACIHKYFIAGKEIAIVRDDQDWLEQTRYYMDHADEREEIMRNGQVRALKDHTYHSRAQQLLDIAAGCS